MMRDDEVIHIARKLDMPSYMFDTDTARSYLARFAHEAQRPSLAAPVAEEVITALRELADGHKYDPLGNKFALSILDRARREAIVSQELARLSAPSPVAAMHQVQPPKPQPETVLTTSGGTPRTDAVAGPLSGFIGDSHGGYVLADFARQLERELAEAEWKAAHRLEMFNQREQLMRDLQTAAMRSAPSATVAPDALTLEIAEALFGSFLHDAGEGEYECGVCEKRVPVDSWVTAPHADDCAVAKARDYLAKHKPECTPRYVRPMDGGAKP